MNLVTIAIKSIRQRALASALTGLSVALGVMLMVSVLVIHGIVERMFSQRSIGYDLIVGPKGSDLQLVLNTVYRVWQPIENLPYLYYRELKNDPRIEHAVPFALGDVTQQGAFPIVGTTEEYFLLDYTPGKKFKVKGHGFQDSFDAIIGARVARVNGWDVGTPFSLVHGGAESDDIHDERFTVVGVLAPTGTPNDKTVFVHLDGFYAMTGHDKPLDEALNRLRKFYPEGIPGSEGEVAQASGNSEGEHHKEHDGAHHADDDREHHPQSDGDHHAEVENHSAEHGDEPHHEDEHHHEVPDVQKEVTAVLVRMKRPPGADPYSPSFMAIKFSSELQEDVRAQAVNPILPMQRLMDLFVGNVRKVLLFLTGLIVVVSGVGIFVSIYNSMADRKREIAIMRALGARRETVFSIILAESVILCFGGGLAGIVLGHGLVFLAGPIVESESGILIDPFAFEPIELVLLPALIVLASLIGFLPGLTAYRTDVAKALSE